jgi:hypothetical protein
MTRNYACTQLAGPRAMLGMAILGAAMIMTPGVAHAQAVALSEREQARRDRNAQHDLTNLRQQSQFVVDKSPAFLEVPKTAIHGEFTVAKVAPEVRLQILTHLEPEHFSEHAYQAGWANWAKVTRSDDNRFYLSASDHLGRGAQINLYEYRPGESGVERVLDISEALGWHKDMWTDGKVHGRKGIMPDGTLWAATHRGPTVTDQWWAEGYRGSWLLSYNIHTGEAKNHGVPLIGQELPVHTLDPQRGIFLATGHLSTTMLSYDINQQRVRYAGSPPHGWIWHARSMFLDSETGHFWGMDSSERPYRFMSFDPELNRFKRHDVTVPANPLTGNQGILRGHTTRPAMDGWYYWVGGGTLFRFRPDWDNGPQIEVVGPSWDKGRDALQLALSPEGRYIYYQPKGYPSPLVQYDVKTGQTKAIAFLQDYYFEKYGYWLGSQVYGMEISSDGSFLVIVENGTFEGRNKSFGHPALLVVSIPPEERMID